MSMTTHGNSTLSSTDTARVDALQFKAELATFLGYS
jgi:hypothetical protein